MTTAVVTAIARTSTAANAIVRAADWIAGPRPWDLEGNLIATLDLHARHADRQRGT